MDELASIKDVTDIISLVYLERGAELICEESEIITGKLIGLLSNNKNKTTMKHIAILHAINKGRVQLKRNKLGKHNNIQH